MLWNIRQETPLSSTDCIATGVPTPTAYLAQAVRVVTMLTFAGFA
jgi:hypothetical protein